MPILKSELTGKERAWAIWNITETEEELSYLAQQSCPEEIIFPQKRLEWLAGRVTIKTVTEEVGLEYLGLTKDEFGKPFLKEHPHQISLSHSYPYVAAQIDSQKPVGIDLEQPKEKLRKVAQRIFSQPEVEDAGDNLTKLCIYWCGKEALYKIYGKKNLLFTDHLHIGPFQLASAGGLIGHISLQGYLRVVDLRYLVMKDFVMVYTA
jgi:4'-phosphopantetheinyl transferase